MGLNISLYRRPLGGKMVEDSAWDSAKLAGDRDFPAVLYSVPYKEHPEDDELKRPTDIPACRAAIAARSWPNPGRFERMMDLLEADPDLWIYFGW
jgi:hypothetical protein